MEVEVFLGWILLGKAYHTRSLIVGLNLPFDFSRLAIGHASAKSYTPPKKKRPGARTDNVMHGGFTFEFVRNPTAPHIQVRHLSKRVSLIRFTTPQSQPTTRSEQRRKTQRPPTRRGYFCDLHSLASALYGGSHTLASLAKLLRTPAQKMEVEAHGQTLNDTYLDYLCNDVEVTWQCFEALANRYRGFGLSKTGVHRIYSEASIGKAVLRQMNVAPWRVQQPDFPDHLLGLIMSTYYGGRSEVRIRRQVVRVQYCDFLSMYPTDSSLMGLWRFARAKGVSWHDATKEIRDLVEHLCIDDLQNPEFWRGLAVLVKLRPSGDVLPVRARYESQAQSIGLNHLTNREGQWFTLADVLVAKLLGGEAPQILEALRFEPLEVQENLAPLDLMGKPAYHIEPERDDLYKRLIELRSAAKNVRDAAKRSGDSETAERYDAEQAALKICANAVCYGIYFELNVDQARKAREVPYWGSDGKRRLNRMRAIEEPGPFFHPLLATLTTAGARLMLGIAEYLAGAEGLGWAFCDTDSFALARPEGMSDAEFLERAERVRQWFEPLNPYDHAGELFKLEDQNFGLRNGRKIDRLAPLYCYAVSAKRYALFNLDRHRTPVLRKVSGHGLGHLMPPYPDDAAPGAIPAPRVRLGDLGVGIRRWQHDLWYLIVQAALEGHPDVVGLDELPGFDAPALSQYAATTPELLSWFATFNRGRSYREQVRPFGFLTAMQVRGTAERMRLEQADVIAATSTFGLVKQPRVAAPFDHDPVAAASHCFERKSGLSVPVGLLRSYAEVLAQYHLHSEAKFANGEYLDRGMTERRHVLAKGAVHIGKEANRWEERFFLGDDPEAEVVYGEPQEQKERERAEIIDAIRQVGVRRAARESGLSLGLLSAIVNGKRRLSTKSIQRLRGTIVG